MSLKSSLSLSIPAHCPQPSKLPSGISIFLDSCKVSCDFIGSSKKAQENLPTSSPINQSHLGRICKLIIPEISDFLWKATVLELNLGHYATDIFLELIVLSTMVSLKSSPVTAACWLALIICSSISQIYLSPCPSHRPELKKHLSCPEQELWRTLMTSFRLWLKQSVQAPYAEQIERKSPVLNTGWMKLYQIWDLTHSSIKDQTHGCFL